MIDDFSKFNMLKIEQVKVNGFKSLRETDVSLNKLNVLIGPNGSGKTNYLEFFVLLQKIISPNMSPSYPFSRWGGYQNISHRLDPEQIIEFEIIGKVDKYSFHYHAKINGINESVNFLFERLNVPDVFIMDRQHHKLIIQYPQRLIDKLEKPQIPNLDGLESKLLKSLLNNSFQESTIGDSVSILNFIHSSGFTHDNDFAYGSLNNNMAIVSDMIPSKNNFPEILFSHILNSLNFFNGVYVKSICDVRTSTLHGHQLLEEDGNGLINLLYNWFKQNNNRFPSIIENAIQTLFPGWELGFNLNQEGIITLIVTHDGRTYVPKNLPDGLLKLIFILAALHTKPKILLIDEIENSLHYDIIRYIIDECNNCEDTIVFMTTHSPQVMNACDLGDIILAERVGSSSSFRHVENIEELTKQLVDINMTFSDTYFDGNL